MNFNASRNVAASGGLRKAKRVSDINAVGPPASSSPPPAYSSGVAPGYDQSFGPAAPQTFYHDNIAMDHSAQEFAPTNVPNNNYNYNMQNNFGQQNPPMMVPNVAQFGSMIQQPIVQDMAMQYGHQLASHGKEFVNREFEKYVPVTKLKYYFAVDTRYVMKKIFLIFFPFTQKEWTMKYEQDMPVQPRYDINAPDLYIPCMAYITYILVAGFMLGLQDRFSPEQISIQSSSALAYIIFEMMLYLMTLYITNTSTNLKTLDLLAFSGYKYLTMIASLFWGLIFGRTGYYIVLLYSSLSLAFFLVRTLKLHVLAGPTVKESQPDYSYGQNSYQQHSYEPSGGSKRRIYFLLFVAVTQPLLSWWLTHHLVPPDSFYVIPVNKDVI